MIKRIRDLAIEVGIAVALICLLVFFTIRARTHAQFEFRWIGLGIWTALAFGYPVVAFRPYWRRPLFWLSFAVLLAMHLAAYLVLFQRPVVDMASVVMLLVTMFEMRVIVAILDRVVSLSDHSKGQRPR